MKIQAFIFIGVVALGMSSCAKTTLDYTSSFQTPKTNSLLLK